jgi:hypothetical protein
MHGQQPVPAVSAAASPDPAEQPTPVVPLARRDQPTHPSPALPVTGTQAPARDLAVQYALDRDTQRWVATIVDQASGQVITTVPSRQVLHLLAELRHTPIDLRA